MRKIFFQIFLLGALFLLPGTTRAVSVDIGFNGGTQDIFFSKEKLIVGDPVRIYASVRNFGDVDVSASVLFYQGVALIDEARPVSVRAKGLSDEVYVDWVVPENSFNIRVEVKGQKPIDENPVNDTALTTLLTPEKPAPPPPPLPPPPSTTSGSSGTPTGTEGLAKSIGSTTTTAKKENKGLAKETSLVSLIALAPPLAPVNEKEKGRVAAAESARTLPEPEPIAVDVVPNDLLKVYLDIRQLGWNAFRFTADVNRADDTSYEWSFGDGKTAQWKELDHAYTFAGRYVVSVVAVNGDGERAQEKATLDISFWHLGNWQLWIVLLLLVGFAVLLLSATRKKKEGHPEDRSAVEEGEMPPVLLQEEKREGTTIGETSVKKKRKPPVRKKKKPEPSPEEFIPPEE